MILTSPDEGNMKDTKCFFRLYGLEKPPNPSRHVGLPSIKAKERDSLIQRVEAITTSYTICYATPAYADVVSKAIRGYASTVLQEPRRLT